MVDNSEKLGESTVRKRRKKESPGTRSSTPVKTSESQLQLSQLTQPEENPERNFDATQATQPEENSEENFDATQATQPEENSEENFDATQMTQCSLQSMTQTSPLKSINSVLLAEESPETGLALALQRPREHVKCSRSKRVTTATGLLPANCRESIHVVYSPC